MNYFSVDLRFRLQGVWREAESVDTRGSNNKFATYQAWFATPFASNTRQIYVPLAWYLDLPKQLEVVRDVSRFWLCAHTLEIESAVWQDGTFVCEQACLGVLQEPSWHQIQDDVHDIPETRLPCCIK
eukprot:1158989-Pelagomonas_calceolata.AAC.4